MLDGDPLSPFGRLIEWQLAFGVASTSCLSSFTLVFLPYLASIG